MAEAPGRSSGSPSKTVPLEHAEGLQGVPARLGEFRLLRRLGKGGMAEVFLAEQTSLKRNVAIKILRRENLTDEVHLKRFEAEAMAAGGLSHPNIVQVYVIGEENGVHYIAQEYVAGQNLRDYITKKGPPELNACLSIMRQVASALQAASDAGIVHRDIKPENIMLTKKGEVKVADFGLAQLTLGGERLNLTRENTTLGTPMYMSPEQVNGSKLDHRSDIYSFGVTCYHMLAGTPPFNGETALQVAVKHLNEEPDPLESVRPDLPPLVCRIVQKMMAKNVDDRYQTAQAIIKDLKRVKQGASDADSRPTVEVSSSRPMPAQRGNWLLRFLDRPPRSQLAWFLGLGLVVVGLGAGGGWLARTKNPFEKPVAARGSDEVPKYESAQKQLLAAMNSPKNEAAWKAVGQYFPGDTLFVRKAQEKLALLYLVEGRTADAKKIFDDFAAAPTSQPERRAFGKAGKAVLLRQENKYQQSQQLLEEVRPSIGQLDRRMQELVLEALQTNQKNLKGEFDKEWDQFLESMGSSRIPPNGLPRPGPPPDDSR